MPAHDDRIIKSDKAPSNSGELAGTIKQTPEATADLNRFSELCFSPAVSDAIKLELSGAAGKEMARTLSGIFDEIDQPKWDTKNGDGFITKEEAIKALAQIATGEKRRSPEQTAAISALAKNVDRLQDLSNDEYGNDNNGVTRMDIAALEDYAEKMSKMKSESEILREIGTITAVYDVATAIIGGDVEKGEAHVISQIYGMDREDAIKHREHTQSGKKENKK